MDRSLDMSGLIKQGGDIDTSLLPPLPANPTKADCEEYGKALARVITESGWASPSEAAAEIKRRGLIFDSALKEIASAVIDEIDREKAKGLIAAGAQVSKQNAAGTTTKNSDPYIDKVEKYLKDLKQKALSPNSADRETYDLWTGEVVLLTQQMKIAGATTLRIDLDFMNKYKTKPE